MWQPKDRSDASPAQGSYEKRASTNAKESMLGFAVIAIALVVFTFAKAIYSSIESVVDDQGWLEHSQDTPTWIGGEWLTGEYRICKMPLMPRNKLPSSAHLLCGENYAAKSDSWPVDFIQAIPDHGFYGLMGTKWDAVEQYFHVLPVKYWGRIDRGDRTSFSWRCQRQISGLECKALN